MTLTIVIKSAARFFQYMQPISLHFSFFNLHIMKNTTSQETSYPLMPSLRVAFKNDETVEEKSMPVRRRKRTEKTKVQPSKSNLPLFDDYRIKAKDHDPL
jgi:hypothetical protein